MTDKNNIETVFREHYRELCLISCYYIHNSEEAQDIVQDLFVKLLSKNRLDHVKDVKSYLNVAVRNATLKYIQKNKKVSRMDQRLGKSIASDCLTKEQEIILLEKKLAIYKEIELLPEQCRKVFLLICVEGLKYRETAEVLEISVNTVKTQIKKAYRILRLSLSEVYILALSAGLSSLKDFFL